MIPKSAANTAPATRSPPTLLSLPGLAARVLLWLAYPAVLLLSGFFTAEERGWLARLRHPGELLESLRTLRAEPAMVDGQIPEVYEAERMDDDARL